MFCSGGIGSVGADAAAARCFKVNQNASNVSNIANAPECAVYASHYYYTELNTARMLHDLNITGSESEEQIRKSLAVIQKEEQIELDELQIRAVIEAVNCGLLVITGDPGTGKRRRLTRSSGILKRATWISCWQPRPDAQQKDDRGDRL